MINEIKTIVKNYLGTIQLSRIDTGTVADGGIRISDKLVVPLVLISGNLKRNIIIGDKVRLLRNLGGQDFFILEIIRKEGE